MRNRRESRQRTTVSTGGFTLVEVMVALVILVIGALSLTQLSLSAALLMQNTSARTELVAAAENRLENVEALPFGDLSPRVEVDTLSIRGEAYLREVTIASEGRRLRRIEIEMRAADGQGLRHSVMTWVTSP